MNPFRHYNDSIGREVEHVDVQSRKDAVERFDLDELRAALEVPGLQKAVASKIRGRIRKLERQS